MQVVGQIPVKQRYQRLDACCTQVIHQSDVVSDALAIDGVTAAAKRNYARPR